jgi:hypothetical protein
MRGRKQLLRIGYVAIYNEEVIFIRRRGEHLLPRGRLMPPHEIYPSSEQWGEYGFSYTPNSHSEPLAAALHAEGCEVRARRTRSSGYHRTRINLGHSSSVDGMNSMSAFDQPSNKARGGPPLEPDWGPPALEVMRLPWLVSLV